ncbi:RAD50-interacting protein 1 isoform X1 [Strongylocentrotus purpuratus]|uniref:RAD50-interacting protein 1 n=1 Tax=Strongylocentrotus purpuratus TaxID=7668 RepID=A0A7M7NRT2_STRPU|nr:RAD50-interacting protein 1 isoform X1 [Strongylocentrotus purpuratus]
MNDYPPTMAEESYQDSGSSMPEYSDEIRRMIDIQIGNDIKKLSLTEDMLQNALDEKARIEQELSTASTEAPSRIQSALLEATAATERLDDLTADYKQTRRLVTSQVTQAEPMVTHLVGLTNQVQELERCMEYLKWMAMVEDLSTEIQGSLLVNSAPFALFHSSVVQQSLSANAMPSAVEHFARLAKVSHALQGSTCVNLVDFVDRTVLFWHKILKEKLESEFEEVLKLLGWPFVSSTAPLPAANLTELTAKLKVLLLQLIKLQLPEALAAEDETSQDYLIIPGSTPLLLPLQLLLQPLKKRFKYHFYGKKLTNSIDKPEWYFTQILNWIRDHSEFLQSNVQPILSEDKTLNIEARTEFTRGLLHTVAAKLKHDIPELLFDDQLLCHTIDELLLFDKELRNSYHYPNNQPGCLHILTEQACFDKWIAIERQFAGQKLDTLFSSPSAWQSQYKGMMEADESKVPECVESFMTLLLVITERYKVLPSPSHHLRFLDLQIDLLDDFRVRLLQVMRQEASNPLGDHYAAILNGVHYIIMVLGEWSDQVFFLQLQYFGKEQSRMESLNAQLAEGKSPSLPTLLAGSPTEALSGTVFDEILSLFELLCQDMCSTIEKRVVNEIKDKARAYQKEKWFSMPSPKDFIVPALSMTACDMLQSLKERLHLLREQLSPALFDKLWQDISSKLNKFLFQEVILTNQFNEGGATQIQIDMTRGLFPLYL